MRISWNLLQLLAYPSLKSAQAQQVRTDEARRMALSMAVITQLRISVERYRLSMEDYQLADTAAQVDQRLAEFARASVVARLDSELEAIRTQARAVLGNYQRANAYAGAQIAFGRLYNTLGFDPLPDDFAGDALPRLSQRVREHLRATEQDTLRMTSNLFGHLPAVAVRVAGVDDPVAQVRMKAQILEQLRRSDVAVDAEAGLPVTFTLRREAREGLEKAHWTIALADARGQARGEAHHASLMPPEARPSAWEATLVAALTSQLPQMRQWLATVAREQEIAR